MALALLAAPASVPAQPDPTRLPVATTMQVPLTAAYNALGVPSLPAGGQYLDPTTGVKIYKLTSSSFPASGGSFTHDYAEGGNEVSLPYTADGVTRAILVRRGTGGPYWIIDFTPGAGVSNPRPLNGDFDPNIELAFTFSSNPATPYFAFVGGSNGIRRFDIRTMTEVPGDGWPLVNERNAVWLHQGENDAFFVWMRGATGPTSVGYEPGTRTLKTHTDSNADEPRVVRGGRYVGFSMSNPNNGLRVWDWQTDTVTWSTSGDPGIPFAHNASLRDRWLVSDFNTGRTFGQFIAAVPNSGTSLPGPIMGSTAYVSGNWIQYPADLDDQWALTYYYGGLRPSGTSWLSPGGMVFMTPRGERRLLAHAYNTSSTYGFYTYGKSSSDGGYVLFTSDMNASGRSDLFLAELPQANGTAQPPTLGALSPNGAAAGGAAFTLTATGTSFVAGSVVQWNGSDRPTTFVSSTQLTAAITAADIAAAGTATVRVVNPAPNGGTSAALTFTITTGGGPVPTLTSVSPSSVTAGGAAFTLTATGTSFVAGSVVQWNGSDRPTTFVSSTQLTAAITAADVATPGTATVRVVNPAPGGGASAPLTFTITAGGNPVPTLTSVSPSSVTSGGAGFTLTATGTNFVAGSVVQWNGSDRPTTFVSSTQLAAAIAAADVATAGTASVRVVTPAPGGGASGALSVAIGTASNPVPVATSISPNSAVAGGPAFTITVNGSNFVPGSIVQFDDGNRTTTFVSSTQLTATILAVDILGAGNDRVTVFSPGPGGGTSAIVPFTTLNPVPSVTTLSPSSVTAGAGALTLTVTGSNFVKSSKVRWNGVNRTTTFVSATQLTAAITAADVAAAGSASVTVFSAAPGGGTSSAMTFTINGAANPVATLTSLSPVSATAGGGGFMLTATGTNFVAGSVVQWNGSARATTFVSPTQLTAAITAADIAAAGMASVTVFTGPPGGGTSGPQTFTITPAGSPAPTLTSLSPTGTTAGGPAFTLTATGTNFVAGSVLRWNGSPRPTAMVSATQVMAAISAADIAVVGSASITVDSPGPGGGTSGALTFTVDTAAEPAAATLVAPSGDLATATPTYTWNAVSGATDYLLWVDDSSGGRIRTWYSAAQAGCSSGTGICSVTPSVALSAGEARWWIVTANTAGEGQWSDAMTFTVPGTPPPGAARLLDPSGVLTTATPTYSWTAVAGATLYLLWVDDSSGGRIRTWYTAEQAGCTSGAGTCSVTPAVALTPGAGQWWIVTANAASQGPWSPALAFTVPGTPPPGAPTPASPVGATSTATPTFTWSAVAGAAQYLLWVDDSSGGRIRTWYPAAAAGCAGGTGTCSIAPGVTLASGAARWWVVAAGDSGQGPWSLEADFTVP